MSLLPSTAVFTRTVATFADQGNLGASSVGRRLHEPETYFFGFVNTFEQRVHRLR